MIAPLDRTPHELSRRLSTARNSPPTHGSQETEAGEPILLKTSKRLIADHPAVAITAAVVIGASLGFLFKRGH